MDYVSERKLVLTDFSGKRRPLYAILSHRWGEEEVLFEDVRDGSFERKTGGYEKIEFCAKQAAQNQLQYFWIDTCCIDKWNRQERSTAINSMFSWYQEAERCYVFLPDVSVSITGGVDLKNVWEESFRSSKWFERGWTLQELIAPRSVEFFSSEGHHLGDKRSLERLLCEITSISPEALQGYPLESFSIPERMVWAESRKTTEPEDSVYCLLGILNVHMPASYGEGKEKARERLETQLKLTGTASFSIPFSRNQTCPQASQSRR